MIANQSVLVNSIEFAKPLVWTCPVCGEPHEYPNQIALGLAVRSGACQMCRLAKTVGHLMDMGDFATLHATLDWLDRSGQI